MAGQPRTRAYRKAITKALEQIDQGDVTMARRWLVYALESTPPPLEHELQTPRECEGCQEWFRPRAVHGRYCSARCRRRAAYLRKRGVA
jgi:hypothetical protein